MSIVVGNGATLLYHSRTTFGQVDQKFFCNNHRSSVPQKFIQIISDGSLLVIKTRGGLFLCLVAFSIPDSLLTSPPVLE